jgi:hypothetical protein
MSEILAAPWTLQSDVWDTLTLGGKEWPGIASIVVTRANKWDEKKAKGSNQAERVYQGTDPASIKITIRFWNDAEQYQALIGECLPLVEPEDEKKRKEPLDISHAVTQARKIGRVTIDSVSGPDDNGDQTWSFSIDATEYRAPTVVRAPSGGKGKATGSSCADLQRAYAYFISEVQRLNLEVGKARIQTQIAEARATWEGSTVNVEAARAYERAVQTQIEANGNSAGAVWNQMQQKGCPLPPSGGGASSP